MKIVVFGAGPIGLVTSLSLCHLGHNVLCIDTNKELIERLQNGSCDLYEKGLVQKLQTYLGKKQIQFSDRPELTYSDIYFIAVGTPSLENGACDLSQLEQCLQTIHSGISKTEKTIVIKSTVSPGTHLKFAGVYKNSVFISHPEFLREGTALDDALNPDRIVIGSSNPKARDFICQIYGDMVHRSELICTDPTTAELAKYAANTFLAARISLINEFSKLADHFGADIKQVSKIVGSDHRIGPYFLNAGLGYGGSCFPKDLQSLISTGESQGISLPMIQAIESANDDQLQRFADLIQKNCPQKSICLWGLVFKPETNDLRHASSLKLIRRLLQDGFKIHTHDPAKPDCFFTIFKTDLEKKNIVYFENHWQALQDCAGLAILTEWPTYSTISASELSLHLQNKPLFDGRNIFEPAQMQSQNINYFSLGQKK